MYPIEQRMMKSFIEHVPHAAENDMFPIKMENEKVSHRTENDMYMYPIEQRTLYLFNNVSQILGLAIV